MTSRLLPLLLLAVLLGACHGLQLAPRKEKAVDAKKPAVPAKQSFSARELECPIGTSPVSAASKQVQLAAAGVEKAKAPLAKTAALLELRKAVALRASQPKKIPPKKGGGGIPAKGGGGAAKGKSGGGIPFDGMFEVGCFVDDTPESEWIRYEEVVPKEDRKPITPTVCFDFCRTKAALFFGLLEGRKCYCTPYPTLSAGTGGQGQCAEVCEGDTSLQCGGMTKTLIYEMHRCGDTTAEAQEDLDALSELLTEAETLSKETDLIVSAMDKATDSIFVTQIRALIQADSKAYAGLIADTNNKVKDAQPAFEELDGLLADCDPSSLTADKMKAIEAAQKKAVEDTANLRDAYDALAEFHKSHDAVQHLKWHSLPSLEEYAEKAKKPDPYAPAQYSRAMNFMPPDVIAKIKCDEKPYDGCDGYDGDLVYFVVEDPDETKPIEPMYEYITPESFGPLGLTEKQPYAWARLQCIDLCRMTFGCVGGNVIGANVEGGGAFRCGLKSNIKRVELAMSKQASYDVSIGGFIFREYYDINYREIKFQTARITTEQ